MNLSDPCVILVFGGQVVTAGYPQLQCHMHIKVACGMLQQRIHTACKVIILTPVYRKSSFQQLKLDANCSDWNKCELCFWL
jgi:hypothetical protein